MNYSLVVFCKATVSFKADRPRCCRNMLASWALRMLAFLLFFLPCCDQYFVLRFSFF